MPVRTLRRDASGFTPMMMMYTLGHRLRCLPASSRRTALRRRDSFARVAALPREGLLEAVSPNGAATRDVEAGADVRRASGASSGPEACHAIDAPANDEAVK